MLGEMNKKIESQELNLSEVTNHQNQKGIPADNFGEGGKKVHV